MVGDAREEDTAIRAVAAARTQFGRLDILINNAGVGIYKNLVDTSTTEYDHLVDTNVRSTFLFTRHAVPVMIEQKRGTILMISSMAGVAASTMLEASDGGLADHRDPDADDERGADLTLRAPRSGGRQGLRSGRNTRIAAGPRLARA